MERLYQQDVYLKEWRAKIEEVKSGPEEGVVFVALDRTAFAPEAGGQPADRGTLGGRQVLGVSEKEGQIWHTIKADPLPEPGAEVDCRLDWPWRFRTMQRHCGEHILSAVFYDLYGGVNRGFHMGDHYMTIDISLEGNPQFTEFTEEMIRRAEWESNRLVWDDLPVRVRYYESREEAAAQPMRKALTLDEDITLVSLGDYDWAPGCVACCGTHPSSTGQVGFIRILRWESHKGMTRIYCEAGKDALEQYQAEAQVFRGLCKRYSAEPDQLDEKIRIQEEKAKEIRQQLYELKKTYMAEKIREIISLPELPSVIIREYPDLRVNDLLSMGKEIAESLPGLMALVSPSENTVILSSNGLPDCGKIVKDNAGVWQGKGGGRAESARAMFPRRQELDCFLDFLQKAY